MEVSCKLTYYYHVISNPFFIHPSEMKTQVYTKTYVHRLTAISLIKGVPQSGQNSNVPPNWE
jgi:hypothetical protein